MSPEGSAPCLSPDAVGAASPAAADAEGAALSGGRGGGSPRAATQPAAEEVQDALKRIEETQAWATRLVAGTTSFDQTWADFQAKFDRLFELGAKKLAGHQEEQPARPAEAVGPLRVAQALRRAARTVVLTGAGVSAESGIPTFRGQDGYWVVGSKNYRPQELATWEKFNEMPEEIWRWFQYRWGVCRAAKPNRGHQALVELEGLISMTLVTQNIDGLHVQAGSNPDRICEIHGRIDEMRCDDRVEGSCLHGLDLNDPANGEKARATVVKSPAPAAKQENERLPSCSRCGKRQRPKVLWFDESYNQALYRSKTALRAAEECDVLLVVGTQLTTGLPQRMVAAARSAGALLVCVDPLVELADPAFAGMLHLRDESGRALPRLLAELRALQAEPLPAPLAAAAGPRGPEAAGAPAPPRATAPARAASGSRGARELDSVSATSWTSMPSSQQGQHEGRATEHTSKRQLRTLQAENPGGSRSLPERSEKAAARGRRAPAPPGPSGSPDALPSPELPPRPGLPPASDPPDAEAAARAPQAVAPSAPRGGGPRRAAAAPAAPGSGGAPRATAPAPRRPLVGRAALRAAAAAALAPAAGAAPQGSAGHPAGFFVYGTLRPDDDSGAGWAAAFRAGMEAEAAVLAGASLYLDGGYPSVCLEHTRCEVRGVLLRPLGGCDVQAAMSEKLAEADRIEGYPGLYHRDVVLVSVAEGGGAHRKELAYLYHRTGRTDRERCACIADGDWLSRRRPDT